MPSISIAYRGRSLEQSYILMRRWKRIEKKHAEGGIYATFFFA